MLRRFLLLEIIVTRVQALVSPAVLLIFNVSTCQLCALWVQYIVQYVLVLMYR